MVKEFVLAVALQSAPAAQDDSLKVYSHCDYIGTMARLSLGFSRLGMPLSEAMSKAKDDPALKAIIQDAYTQPGATRADAFEKKWVDRCIANPKAFGFKPSP